MAAVGIPSSWEELPEDILGQVLKRLPSLGDRVRLRAVCRPWRSGAAARRHPLVPPPLPWLALHDGTLVDIHGVAVRCGPILRPGVDVCYLPVDNLAFLVGHDGGCSLMNPLSGLTLPLPKLGPAVRRAIDSSFVYRPSDVRMAHVKVKILASPVDPTPDPLVATIITEGYSVAITPCKDHLPVDNLAFIVGHDGECSLMNPLSGLKLPLPKLAPAVRRAVDSSTAYRQSDIRKVHVKVKILSSPVDPTPDPLVATIITEGYSVAITPCKDHDAISISIDDDGDTRITDIAFFSGELYALTDEEGLYIMKLDVGGFRMPKFSQAFHLCIADDPKQQQIYHCHDLNQLQFFDPRDMPSGYLVERYLAESNGRLLMVRRWMSFPRRGRLGDHDKTFRFEVFEVNLATIPGQWIKVETLGDQALFLGLQCSKSVLGSQFAGGVREDCIYFMHRTFDQPYRGDELGHSMDPLADSGVYNMRNGEIMPLLPEAVMAKLQGKRQFLTWFFPADE